MLRKLKIFSAAAIFGVAFASTASAATIEFLGGSGYTQAPSLDFSDGTVTATATGFNYTPNPTIGAAVVLGTQVDVTVQASQGLGVCDGLSNDTEEGDCRQPQIDAISNNGGPELAKFTFSQAITVTSVTFNQNDNNDDIDIFAGTPLSFALRDTTSLSGGPTGDVIDLTGLVAFQNITMFGVGIFDAPAQGNNSDQVRLASITYEIAPVPVPAAGWMLIAAVGGLGAMRRRQK